MNILEQAAWKAWKDCEKENVAYDETDEELEAKYDWNYTYENHFKRWWVLVCAKFAPTDFRAATSAAWRQVYIEHTPYLKEFMEPEAVTLARRPETAWDWEAVGKQFDGWFEKQVFTQTAPTGQIEAEPKQKTA